MSLIKHSCPNCSFDLEFPEQVGRICCPRCGNHFLIEIFEEVVSLKRIKEEPSASIETAPPPGFLSDDLSENIVILDKQIDRLNRQLIQRRSSAFSSLSVSILFFFFALVWLLADRNLIGLLCAIIAAVMGVVAGMRLRDSARSRGSLTILISKREQLARQLKPNIPRVF